MIDLVISKGERTQIEILQAAHHLFLVKGFHGTSMREIAQEAGITVSGIYNHFTGKEAIFEAILYRFHPYHKFLPAIITAQGDTIEAYVQDAATRMVESLGCEGQEILNLLFIELVEFGGCHLTGLFDAIYPQVMEFAQRFLVSAEELRPIPVPILVRAFLGLFFSYCMIELLLGKQLAPEMQQDALSYFVDIFLHGILPNE